VELDILDGSVGRGRVLGNYITPIEERSNESEMF
jgi:hypothetical protein